MVHGTLMAGFAQACINLNIVAGRRAPPICSPTSTSAAGTRWPGGSQLEQTIGATYLYCRPDPAQARHRDDDAVVPPRTRARRHPPRRRLPALPDRQHRHRLGHPRAEGELVGSFDLREFDPRAGRAVIHSTTPFNRKIECGVLIGGLLAPGDIDYVDVTNDADPDLLVVEFH
jgi:hypothetical protein